MGGLFGRAFWGQTPTQWETILKYQAEGIVYLPLNTMVQWLIVIFLKEGTKVWLLV